MSDWVNVLSAGVAALVAGLGVWFNRRQINASAEEHEASAAEKTVATALDLIAPMREQLSRQADKIEALEEKVTALAKRADSDEARIRLLETGVAELTSQIRELGFEPKWIEPGPGL